MHGFGRHRKGMMISFMFLCTLATSTSGAHKKFLAPKDERMDQTLPGPIGLRVDHLTLEEIEQELEKLGVPKPDRDKIIERTKQDREKRQGSSPSLAPMVRYNSWYQ